MTVENEIKTNANAALLEGLKREPTNKVVLLYSGGIDSTAVGLLLRQQGKEVFPLYIDYGQSAKDAEAHITAVAPEQLGFSNTFTVKTDILNQLTKSKLLGRDAIDDSDAWVPGRNTLFMVIAGIYSQQINADGIAVGYMLDDNFVFGDNDYFHHKSVEELLSKSFLQPVEVFLPAQAKTKKDLIELLQSQGYLELTVSCWNAKLEQGSIVACSECANCKEKARCLTQINGDAKTS